MNCIHPTAVVGPQVQLADDVTIGPYTVLDGAIEVGAGCHIGPHCHLTGTTRVGPRTRIHAGAIIGDEPQDHAYRRDTPSATVIGADCVIREYATIHRGTDPNTATVIGDQCMIMGFVHIAHNCQIGTGAVLANMTMLAGHVHVGERAFLSGGTLAHQFVRIGALVIVTASGRCGKDVPPYCLFGEGDMIYGPNVIGLRRAGFSAELRDQIKAAIHLYFFNGLKAQDAIAQIQAKYGTVPEVAAFAEFLRTSRRGITRGCRAEQSAQPG